VAEDTQTAIAPVGDGAHVVAQGECIYSIAARTGHRWQTLWDHPSNRELRQARKDPGILLPGDRVFVPELAAKTVELASGKRHRIVIDGQRIRLRLRMCDPDGEPIAGADYRLHVGERSLTRTTNDTGYFEVEVPALTDAVRLLALATGETFTLRIGHMDPRGSAGGVRKRLANLGYHPGGDEDAMTAALDQPVAVLLDDFSEDAGLGRDPDRNLIACQLERTEPWTA
jgi:hypothetical protein